MVRVNCGRRPTRVDRIRDGSEAYITSRKAKFKQMIKNEYSKNALNQVCKKILEIPRRIEQLIKHRDKPVKSDM